MKIRRRRIITEAKENGCNCHIKNSHKKIRDTITHKNDNLNFEKIKENKIK